MRLAFVERIPLSRVMCRLPAIVAAAAYLAAAVGGTGLHALVGGHHHGCGHSHCGHDHLAAGEASSLLLKTCEHAHACGHDHAGPDHAAAGDHAASRIGDKSESGDSRRDTPVEPHDAHHCAVCQFLAMGQQLAAAPRPVDVAGPVSCPAMDVAPSVGRALSLTKRVRGPPATV